MMSFDERGWRRQWVEGQLITVQHADWGFHTNSGPNPGQSVLLN